MRVFKPVLGAIALVAAGAWAAQAEGTGAHGVFQIYNNTTGNVVSGFYTSADGGSTWSDNWLSIQIRPGESAEATFHADEYPCDQVFQVGWVADGGGEVLDDEISIDICDASNVYLEDNDISYD